MKKLFGILLFFVLSFVLDGQDPEQVFLFSDRSLYISGEKIRFSAVMISSGNAVSNVLYVELISPGGTRITGGKFLLDGSVAASALTIPQEVITGIYFLRAYTRYMRNDRSLTYHIIRIVNPYRNEVIAGRSDSSSISENAVMVKNDFFRIMLDNEIVAPGDTLHAIIQKEKNDSVMLSSVSAQPANLPEDSLMIVSKQSDERRYYDPEKDGVFLSGIVRDSGGNPAPGIRVNLSVLGRGQDFMAVQTDTAGRFEFYLRGYEGKRDLFLAPENTDRSLIILADNDFSTAPVSIRWGSFSLTEEERIAALKMARNFQVDSLFYKKAEHEPDTASAKDFVPFYGTPDEVIDIDSYIQLPTLEEYFNGLPTLVKVRKKGTRKYFKVMGNQPELASLDPLVMVDLVAIDDPEKILAINPRDLKRIEIINAVYLKGDQLYGGIINLVSRKGDFAGINLPGSGLFLSYSFPEKKRDIHERQFVPGMPDTRNTVLWIPELKISDESAIEIVAPAAPGKYEIIVKGVTKDLKLFRAKAFFEVISKNRK
ncbi:MAG TPA: hypothetical protein VHO68_02985 [Bacteroidales bacterium]|nr:hypothetical protein [Bacteroidales bacterium]